ncbi:hypothetical protein Vi05172_g7107 [Venturia inaequalis]|nr:hypothetical protein Vi05172_g7107 [Venturia inaequalis]
MDQCVALFTSTRLLHIHAAFSHPRVLHIHASNTLATPPSTRTNHTPLPMST